MSRHNTPTRPTSPSGAIPAAGSFYWPIFMIHRWQSRQSLNDNSRFVSVWCGVKCHPEIAVYCDFRFSYTTNIMERDLKVRRSHSGQVSRGINRLARGYIVPNIDFLIKILNNTIRTTAAETICSSINVGSLFGITCHFLHDGPSEGETVGNNGLLVVFCC